MPGAEASLVLDDDPSVSSGATLGGLFRLSGYAPFELIGREGVLGRVIVYRQLNRKVLEILPTGWYAGVALEAGNVFQADQSIDASDLLYGGTAFVGADTPIGPLILGIGYADPDRTRVYLSFGRSFF
jgi:NTE family protein